MSLKDRLRSKKEAKAAEKAEICEFKISIKKVTEAIAKAEDSADLGNIIKEFAKFLDTLTSENAKIVFSGNFDLGKRTLLNCILGNFLEDNKVKEKVSFVDEQEKQESKLIKKRKSIRSKLKEVMAEDDMDVDSAKNTEE